MVKSPCKATTAGGCFGFHCGALGCSYAYADGALADYFRKGLENLDRQKLVFCRKKYISYKILMSSLLTALRKRLSVFSTPMICDRSALDLLLDCVGKIF